MALPSWLLKVPTRVVWEDEPQVKLNSDTSVKNKIKIVVTALVVRTRK